jgi:hypothetical protein
VIMSAEVTPQCFSIDYLHAASNGFVGFPYSLSVSLICESIITPSY